MIANSGHDERGKYSGGKAGDQTGQEWTIQPWYNRPWNCVLRYPATTVRECIASLATEAAQNNNIGYDQNQRTTFWNKLKSAGYRPKNITEPCEADCSAGVAAIVKAAGYLLGIKALQNVSADMYTGNERQVLKAAGFDVLTSNKYLASDKYLLRGDILLYEGHHTAINLTTGQDTGWHWVHADGKWYYQDADGMNTHGWRDIKETNGQAVHRYYFDKKGAAVTGAVLIDGGWHFFQPDGPLECAECVTDAGHSLVVWCE